MLSSIYTTLTNVSTAPKAGELVHSNQLMVCHRHMWLSWSTFVYH